MPWPLIPRLIYSDDVRVKTLTGWTSDRSKGRKPLYSEWSSQTYPCSVSAASAEDSMEHSRESQIVSHVVTANKKLGGVQDQLEWQETGSVFRILNVLPAGDRTGRIFEHFVEEYAVK
jgi:hypothetical protein